MPKRRNTQLDFGNNDLQDSSSHPPTTATSGPQHLAQPQERTVLLKLSDACRKHSKFHHNQKASMRADENEADIPDRCRTDIQTLRLLLPRVEKSCKAPKSGQKGGLEATDVAHLCAFYYSVIQGTYCPHQPHIFQWGKGGLEVLPRVHYLFRHLTSRAVISNTKSLVKESDDTSVRPVADTVSQTIAHLLSFIPDESFYPIIIEDLIDMLLDLSVIVESELLKGKDSIEILILGGTLAKSQLEQQEMVVDVPNLDVILSLQASVFTILGTFLMDLQQRRLGSQPETVLEPSTSHGSTLPAGEVDVVFYEFGDQAISRLLSGIRQVLLVRASSFLRIKSQLAAAELLAKLVQDWHVNGVVANRVVEAAILVARAVLTFMGSSQSEREACNDYAEVLANLIQNLLLSPPRVRGMSSKEALWTIRAPTLTTFLDCIPFISRYKTNSGILEFTVVRALYAFIYTVHLKEVPATAIALNYCEANGIATHLFALLGNLELSIFVVWIIRALLYPVDADPDACSEIVSMVCRLAFNDRAKGIITAQSKNVDDPMELEQKDQQSKSKRKRQAGSPRKNSRRHPQALDIQLSPTKRQINDSYRDETAAFDVSFLIENLGDFFAQSLVAARRLLESFKQSESVVSLPGKYGVQYETSGDSTFTPADDIATVLSGIHILFDIARHRFATGENDEIEHMLELVCCLLAPLSVFCESHNKRGAISLSSSDRVVAEAVVSCGLHAHFTLEFALRIATSDAGKRLKSVLDTFTTFCSRLCTAEWPDAPQEVSSRLKANTRFCTKLCKRGTSAFRFLSESKGTNLGQCSDCPCSTILPGYLGELSQNFGDDRVDSVLDNDSAMAVLCSLPLRARFTLYASVRPGDECRLHPQGSNPMFAFIDEIRTSPLQDLDKSSIVSALVMAPLLLLSLSLTLESEAAESPVLPVDADFNLKLRSHLLTFLGEILGPLAEAFRNSPQGSIHAPARILSICRLRWLTTILECSEKDISNVLHDPCAVVKYLSGDLNGLGIEPTLCDKNDRTSSGADRLLREITFQENDRSFEDVENPHERLLRWICFADICLQSPCSELRQQVTKFRLQALPGRATGEENDESVLPSALYWLLAAPFSDPDPLVREYSSREVARLLLDKECGPLFAMFAIDEEWQTYSDYFPSRKFQISQVGRSNFLTHASDSISSRLFREIDRHLHENCGFSESQMSFTMAKTATADPLSHDDQRRRGDRPHLQRSAIRTLASFCNFADFDNPCGKFIFEKALLRLIRIWAATQVDRNLDSPFHGLSCTSSVRSVAFGELSRLSDLRPIGKLIGQESSETLTAAFFCDILILSSGESRERQYHLLETFIRFFVVPSREIPEVLGQSKIDLVAEFVEEKLPAIVAQFVVEKDFDLLRLTAGYRDFVDGRMKSFNKDRKSSELIIGGSNVPSRRKHAGIGLTIQELEKKARNLCLEPKLIERILPLVLGNSDRSGLVFFTRDVLKGITLHQIIEGREQLILKGLVWELGKDPDVIGPAMRAIRTAAIARAQEQQGSGQENDVARVALSDENPVKDAARGKGTSAASDWVTSQFMYLLVNVVQYKWKTRSIDEQLHSLRCLNGLLDFLLPAESPQYFPQIMATVNVAIVHQDSELITPEDESGILGLRLLAVQALSKFVRLVVEHHWETIALNLTTVVVSLIPVLEMQESTEFDDELWTVKESLKTAVSLLEHLTHGELGRNLARHFTEIPFLPPSPALESVRKALLANGVDFDNLLVLSSGTQHPTRRDGSLTSDGGTCGSSFESRRSEKIAALQKRLSMVCALLDNENSNVRRVVLQHLTDLLRANRQLFQALVDNEGSTSMKLFLTVRFRNSNSIEPPPGSSSGITPGTVTEMLEKLMTRCVHETDTEARVLLASCLGEVGAISEHRLGEIKTSIDDGDGSVDAINGSYTWRLHQPPWQSREAKYELQLVTKHLVVALKAAPSSADQHKIAFTIQQLLVLLDSSARLSAEVGVDTAIDRTKGSEMSKWLADKLRASNVYNIIEPFWSSEFSEKSERFKAKQPPFFQGSVSYFAWISDFCRWMVGRSRDCSLSRWSSLFFACRTAVRTEAGLKVAEFILPLLILDRICFGNAQDEEHIRQEIIAVLTFDTKPNVAMSQTERQKAVNALFMVVDTLCFWAEHETEERHRSSSRSNGSSSSKKSRDPNAGLGDVASSTTWPSDDTIVRTEEVLNTIPLSLLAQAAGNVGMHARALRLLEMVGRRTTVEKVFNTSSDPNQNGGDSEGYKPLDKVGGIDLHLLKNVLARLDDCETMAAVGEESSHADPSSQVRDSIRQNEASGNWEAALQDYERALQLEGVEKRDPLMEKGALQCLLELGQFESVLNQVNGLVHVRQGQSGGKVHATSLAVEAAWRLGRWETLSGFVKSNASGAEPDQALDTEDTYQISVGKAMLGLHRKDSSAVASALENARQALMQSLSSVARESYARSYSHMVRLHCLREIENAGDILCANTTASSLALAEMAQLDSHEGWAWNGRLGLVSSQGSTTVINTRLALARLSSEPVLEGSLFVSAGKKARKTGLHSIAANFFSHAEAAFACIPSTDADRKRKLGNFLDPVKMQIAKLKHASGESTTALKLLGQDGVQKVFDQMMLNIENSDTLRQLAMRYERRRIGSISGLAASVADDDRSLVSRFASRLLKLTQWAVEGGLKGGSEIMGRFRVIHKLVPDWEKGHFHFGKYVDSMMQSRVTALATRSSEQQLLYGADEDLVRANIIFQDKTCQKYILTAMEHYAKALKLDSKHVYQALPRLLSLWFDFTSIQKDKIISDSNVAGSLSMNVLLEYLSRHQNDANACMANNLKSIPPAAFYTAMPQLVSRVIHDDKETALVVQGILKRVLAKFPQQAMWPLAWLKGSKNDERLAIGEDIFKDAQKSLSKQNQKAMYNLLTGSSSLFKYLTELAKFSDIRGSSFEVKPWKGNVELSEFIPPVQAALAVSSLSPSSSGSKEFFPRNVPRMRSISPKVGVMNSKAKPKKLKAFAVPGTYKSPRKVPSKSTSLSHPAPGDIGEIHFLVKQEARGDLRKDARVQDLNNVINRLMASSNETGGSSRRRRRLHLRTFTVTCLSEDSGILEWVPNTDSMRNLILKSYNPQANPTSATRRGSRLANFNEIGIRNNYERAQNAYFKSGSLSRATLIFEESCLKPYPPLFYWWFVQKFHDPHAWYEARTRFTLSAAVWSAVGHVIGLGDRHSENILVDTVSGDVVHVDFDCIFDKGLNLPRPEVVPFRLTPNMLDAFGPTGADGVYSGGLQTAMKTLRDNRDTLLSVLEPFLKDPIIDWKRSRNQQKDGQVPSTQERQTREAKRSINVIDERLRGIYNLQNPNLRKYRRTDSISMDRDEELTSLLPLSVEGQVHKMIAEALSHENLVQLYVGWMPWV